MSNSFVLYKKTLSLQWFHETGLSAMPTVSTFFGSMSTHRQPYQEDSFTPPKNVHYHLLPWFKSPDWRSQATSSRLCYCRKVSAKQSPERIHRTLSLHDLSLSRFGWAGRRRMSSYPRYDLRSCREEQFDLSHSTTMVRLGEWIQSPVVYWFFSRR